MQQKEPRNCLQQKYRRQANVLFLQSEQNLDDGNEQKSRRF